ncbi:MAG: hypothetical protein FRX48_06349 [Lasallia pustulata]|uniref:Uncharacterized protein n=1 Tax=Lasallia pustulata TaxID=136370 RepID=A0A5M8PK07_9LECA|nr:MAG: hypothetical protein FRX48_06349 [Lasallia pustulata]
MRYIKHRSAHGPVALQENDRAVFLVLALEPSETLFSQRCAWAQPNVEPARQNIGKPADHRPNLRPSDPHPPTQLLARFLGHGRVLLLARKTWFMAKTIRDKPPSCSNFDSAHVIRQVC